MSSHGRDWVKFLLGSQFAFCPLPPFNFRSAVVLLWGHELPCSNTLLAPSAILQRGDLVQVTRDLRPCFRSLGPGLRVFHELWWQIFFFGGDLFGARACWVAVRYHLGSGLL